MRRMSALVLVFGVAVVAAQVAVAAHRAPIDSLRVSYVAKTTGTIKALGLTRITVARTTCSMQSPKIADLVGGFAVGENVTVDCVNGSLRSIVLAPETSGPTHPDSIVASVDPRPTQPFSAGGEGGVPGCGVGGAGTITWTSGTTGSRSETGTICATGTVTAVSSTGITVNDQTCPLLLGSNPLLPSNPFAVDVQVGEQVVMGCVTFSNGQSNGSISRST